MRRILLLTIKCRYCNKQWCITENDKEYLKGCPFCTKDITKPISNDIAVDSFENAIHKTLAVNGLDILKNRSMFISYLMDVGYDYRKEVKILSNAIDQKTFNEKCIVDFEDIPIINSLYVRTALYDSEHYKLIVIIATENSRVILLLKKVCFEMII